MTLSEELQWRGLLNQTTIKDLNTLDNTSITFYWGVDPSADSMTIGNLAAAMLVKNLIKHGHKAVALIGGATGLIGDPDGKSQERDLITQDEINSNKEKIVAQYNKIFGEGNFDLVDNYDWFKDFGYLNFLREVGKNVPMRQMLGRDFVQSRLSEDGKGISYAEFSYVLIQAYDFLYLFNNHNVTLQVCGADQWGNSIAGVDLIRRKTGNEANVLSIPLIVDDITGVKFGKSEEGAIWLDPNKTTPTSFYQFWINLPDNNVESYLKIFTELSKEEIENLIEENKADFKERIAQKKLAYEVTKLVHGEAAAIKAQKVTDVLTSKVNLNEINDENLLNELRKEIPNVKIVENAELAQVLVDASLASSKTEARQLIANNAVSINGQKSTKETLENSDFIDGRLILRRGKAFKDSALVEIDNK